MTRADILTAAGKCVMQDRNATHGEPEDNFKDIAGLWSEYLEAKWKRELPPFTPEMVAAFMVLMKLARTVTSPEHPEHWIDIAGYAACGGQCATTKKTSKALIDFTFCPTCKEPLQPGSSICANCV